jgi:hypothetical protein
VVFYSVIENLTTLGHPEFNSILNEKCMGSYVLLITEVDASIKHRHSLLAATGHAASVDSAPIDSVAIL